MSKYTMNKYGVTEKGQEAVNLIGACLVILVIAMLINKVSPPGAGVSVTAAPVPFDFSHSPTKSPGGRSPLSAGGYNQCAETWPEVDK